ncbi:hypothetical protein GCM10027589_04260 [Actinocorallia lasiicapitis]
MVYTVPASTPIMQVGTRLACIAVSGQAIRQAPAGVYTDADGDLGDVLAAVGGRRSPPTGKGLGVHRSATVYTA